jgi:hypothetical protein
MFLVQSLRMPGRSRFVLLEVHCHNTQLRSNLLHAFLLASLMIPAFAAQRDADTAPTTNVNSREFKVEKLGDARGWDKAILGFSVLKNDAGVTVAILQGTFRCSEAAEREIDDDLRYPPNILEQGQAKDASGNVVGKRVVVTYEVPVTHKKYVAIVWNNGRKYHRVASQSSAVAETFEASIKADDEKATQLGPKKQ